MSTNLLPALPVAIAAVLLRSLKRVGGAFWRCYERRQQRLVLASLDPQQLHDLGLSRNEAMIEAEKSFWR